MSFFFVLLQRGVGGDLRDEDQSQIKTKGNRGAKFSFYQPGLDQQAFLHGAGLYIWRCLMKSREAICNNFVFF